MPLTKKQTEIIARDADEIESKAEVGTFDKEKYINQITDINTRIEDRLEKFEVDGVNLLRELYPHLPGLMFVTVAAQKAKIKDLCDPMFMAVNLVKDPELKILIVNCLKDLLDIYVRNSEEFKNRDSFDNPLH
jgi:hypothetical protein